MPLLSARDGDAVRRVAGFLERVVMVAQYGFDPTGIPVYFGGIFVGVLGVLTLLHKDRGSFPFWCGCLSVGWSGLAPALFGPIPLPRSDWFLPVYSILTVFPALIAIIASASCRPGKERS